MPFSQDTLNPFEALEAQIQSRVAEFLGLKSKLLGLIYGDSALAQEANMLLVDQKRLEQELGNSLSVIEQAKLGVYSFSDVISVGAFYAQMEMHIRDVNNLLQKYSSSGGDVLSLGAGLGGISPWLIILGAGIIAIFVARK